jgi:hypothetical protein
LEVDDEGNCLRREDLRRSLLDLSPQLKHNLLILAQATDKTASYLSLLTTPSLGWDVS